MNSRACCTPFCPTVASSTSSTSCGAPSTSRAATRRILSSSFIRLTRVCRRPAVSTSTGSQPARLRRLDRVEHDRGRIGVRAAPARSRRPARLVQISSCSTAAARNVSAAQTSGVCPSCFSRLASLPIGRRLAGAVDADDEDDVRVRPGDRRRGGALEDGQDLGRAPAAAGSRRAAPCGRTASTMRSVAATPTSHVISASSSASTVLDRRRGRGRGRRRGVGRLAPSCLERAERAASLVVCRLGLRRSKKLTRNRSVTSRLHPAIADWQSGRAHAAASIRVRCCGAASASAAAVCVRPASTSAICSAIGSSTPWRRAERQVPRPCSTPSATIRMPARISAADAPARVRRRHGGCGSAAPVHVSTRSPSPLRPASVSRRPPIATASRDISARPRVTSAASALWPRPEALDHARGNRDHVLERAADLDADHVVGAVQAEALAAELLLHAPARRGVGRGGHAPPSAVPARPRARNSAPTARRPGSRRRQFLGEHLGHARPRDALEALGGADDNRARPHGAGERPHRGARAVRRHGPHDHRRVRDGRGGLVRRLARRRATRALAGTRRSRASRACATRDRHRAPTAARRARHAPGAPPAPCPTIPRPRPSSSQSLPQAPLGAEPEAPHVRAVPEHDECRRGARAGDDHRRRPRTTP